MVPNFVSHSFSHGRILVGECLPQTLLQSPETAIFLFLPKQEEMIRQAITGVTIHPIIKVSAASDELLSAVGRMTAEYGKIGSNLNQIAKFINETHTPYPNLAEEVRTAVSDLAKLKFEVLEKVGDAVGNDQTYQL